MEEKKIMESAAANLERVLLRHHSSLESKYIKLLKSAVQMLRKPPEMDLTDLDGMA
jgi:hypothetical protein